MNRKAIRILVLSDSALSSLGGVFENALDLFKTRCAYDVPVTFDNPSVAGMTAADAAAHYGDLAETSRYDAVIVCLANCDACGFGHRGRRGFLGGGGPLARLRDALYRKRTPLARRNRPYAFAAYPLCARPPERCVSPDDYARFIAEIVRRAAGTGTEAILVEPASKRDFPPCNNTGNVLFYKVMNVQDDQPLLAGESASALTGAIRLQGAGRLDEAEAAYSRVIDGASGSEQSVIAQNNIASIFFERGDPAAARDALDAIPARGIPLPPMIEFNRAVACRALGETDRANALFAAAREADTGTYRVTERYREALARIEPGERAAVHRIGMARLLSDDDFVDYCHPTAAAHGKLFEALREAVERSLRLRPGTERPTIRYLPLNPDRYAGHTAPFWEHVGIVTTADAADAAGLSAEAERTPYGEILERSSPTGHDREAGHLRILRHPLFGDPAVLRLSPPGAPADGGRLPELYALRHMIPLYRRLPNDTRLAGLLGATRLLLPAHERLDAWWPTLGDRAPVPPAGTLAAIFDGLDTGRVLERTALRLRRTTALEPVAFDRYRTITYWFFRESLLFGSASHWSIYTDRCSLREIVDACLFVLAHERDDTDASRGFARILRGVEALLDIQRRFLESAAHRLYAVPADWLDRYRSAVGELAASFDPAGPGPT